MRLFTVKLLIISAIITGLTLLASTFWEQLGLGAKQASLLAFAMMIAFGVNIAGVILGISERHKDSRKATVGIIGNTTLIILFLSIATYALLTIH